ncbi:TonB-dependent receptor, partial [Klebsiella pneumoniae]|nr:TonB-dependent receptor [Klebsiella pneumoniae]
ISPQYFTQRVRGDYEYATLYEYMADLQPSTFAERSIGDTPYYGNQTAWYFYAQDTWRLRPNFTLTLGVRYEYTTIPKTQRLQSLNAIASVPG